MEITGRVTGDAIVKGVKNSDKQVVSFSVAINHTYRSKDATEPTRKVVFVECDFWRSAGIAPFLTKGIIVQLFGYPDVTAYVNKKNIAVGVLRLHVQHIELISGSNKDAAKEGDSEETAVETELVVEGETAAAGGGADDNSGGLPF